jgi:hypothetical protein
LRVAPTYPVTTADMLAACAFRRTIRFDDTEIGEYAPIGSQHHRKCIAASWHCVCLFGVNNGCAGRSPDTSAVPQLADDVGAPRKSAEVGLVSRASSVHTAMRNYTGDEGRSFEFDNQVLISSHRKLLWSKARVVNVAEKAGQDPVRHGRERRA